VVGEHTDGDIAGFHVSLWNWSATSILVNSERTPLVLV